MSDAIVSINTYNEIREGYPGPEPFVNLPAKQEVPLSTGTKYFYFRDNSGKHIDMHIEGQRAFNMRMPYEKANYELLQLLTQIDGPFQDLTKALIFNNPEADAETAEKLFELEVELIAKLRENQTNAEFLEKVHRRVIGLIPASGIKTVFMALVGKAKTDPKAFRHKEHGVEKWVFDGALFEFEALLDKGKELGALIVDDNGRYSWKDGTLLGIDRPAVLLEVQKNIVVREHLQRTVADLANLPTQSPVQKRPDVIEIEDSDMLDKINALGQSEPEEGDEPSGDEKAVAARALVQALVDQGIIQEVEDGKFSVAEMPGSPLYNSLEEIEIVFRTNEELMRTYEEELN